MEYYRLFVRYQNESNNICFDTTKEEADKFIDWLQKDGMYDNKYITISGIEESKLVVKSGNIISAYTEKLIKSNGSNHNSRVI